MIRGSTSRIAHIGYPTHTFKSPMIYNPWFEEAGIDAVVVPMGCQAPDFPAFLKAVFSLTNIRGALITMPHKVSVMSLLDEVSATGRIAGACNAVRRDGQGRLVGDMFDGEGFVRGARRKGVEPGGARALVVGTGGVGSAIAASLAAAGVARLSLFDVNEAGAQALAARLREHYAGVEVSTGSKDPAGHDIVVNATPMGMNEGDPLPMDVSRIEQGAFVGEVVMKAELTPFLVAAIERGCKVQVGTDMLFEQIPAYLEYFGFPAATPEKLRELARLSY